jgi:hypothetical protein
MARRPWLDEIFGSVVISLSVKNWATVCGKVVSTHYAKSSKGEPTFLNLDEPYPKEVFTTLIWGSDRAKLGAPEDEYKGLRVCVTGKITSYRGRPEIMATERGQIEIQK